MMSSKQIGRMLRKIKPFISYAVDSRWTKFAVFSNTGLKKLSNRSEFLFSFLSSFYKMAPNGTVSHDLFRTLALHTDLTSFGPYAQAAVRIFFSIDNGIS